jgi:hypothetical protein
MKIWRVLASGFIEVDMSKEMIDAAEKRNQEFYSKYGNKGTHRQDKTRQRMTGYLAEMAVKHVFNKLEFSEDDSVDFVFNGVTFDVKAQGCNSAPELKFVGTLYEEQASRNVDFYIFARVKNDSSKVWIAGFISKNKLFKTAQLISKGTANENFTYDQSRYEIPYFKLEKAKNVGLRNEL